MTEEQPATVHVEDMSLLFQNLNRWKVVEVSTRLMQVPNTRCFRCWDMHGVAWCIENKVCEIDNEILREQKKFIEEGFVYVKEL